MKQLLIMFLFLCSATAFAQDVIVKKDGSTILCRVVQLDSTEIVYKKWSDLNGSNYVMNRTDASAINYENGKRVNLAEMDNLYKPGNQNDGMRQYNDRELLKIDAAVHSNNVSNIKLRTIGWVGGGILAASGLCFIIFQPEFGGIGHNDSPMIGAGLLGAGVACTTTFLLIANHQKKKAQMLYSSAIYQYDFKFSNGTTLSTGLDMLSDRTVGNNTIGIGLRYNF